MVVTRQGKAITQNVKIKNIRKKIKSNKSQIKDARISVYIEKEENTEVLKAIT